MSTSDQPNAPEGHQGHPWGAPPPQPHPNPYPAPASHQWSSPEPDSNGPGHPAAPEPAGHPQANVGPGHSAPGAVGTFAPPGSGMQQYPGAAQAGSTAPAGMLGRLRSRRRRRRGGIVGFLVAMLVVALKVVGASALAGSFQGAPKMPAQLDGIQQETSAEAQKFETEWSSQVKKDNPRAKMDAALYRSTNLVIAAAGLNRALDESDDQWRQADIDPKSVTKVGKAECGVATGKGVICQRSSWRKSAVVAVYSRTGQTVSPNGVAKILDELWTTM